MTSEVIDFLRDTPILRQQPNPEMTMSIPQSSFLRRTLVLDASVSGATALLLVSAAGLLANVLALPETLLRYAGGALVPFVIFVAYVARQPNVPRAGVFAIIMLNVVWVLASVWLLLGDQVRPNAMGAAFIIVQAVAVALFAELQYIGLRRATRPERDGPAYVGSKS
jgi:hypothetical protein